MELVPGLKDQRRRTSVEELERERGFRGERWDAFKARVIEGDELWEYCSARKTWDQGLGGAGIELVREGQSIALLTTRMN